MVSTASPIVLSQSIHVWEFHFTLEAYDLSAGFMQFMQSVPVAEVLATEGNIQVMQYNTVLQSCFGRATFLQSSTLTS